MEEEVIPVFLFLGFLEAGKTLFIQSMLEDDRFAPNENILLIACEEGIEEYSLDGLNKRVTLETIDDETGLEASALEKLAESSHAQCIIIEYNGMWNVRELFTNMPESWGIFQTIFIADAQTFMQYTVSFGPLVSDKLNACDLAVLNRDDENTDKQAIHKSVRLVNRRAGIGYQGENGELIPDGIDDPLPYDIDADTVVIEDRDYAVFYSDVAEDMKKYIGKTLSFKAIVARTSGKGGNFAVGRYVMACCAEDMQFCWFGAHYGGKLPDYNSWASVTAKVQLRHDSRRGVDYPFMEIVSIEPTQPPEEETATFY